MRMRVAKICPPVNKPTRLISPKSSGPEVGLLSGDYCIYVDSCEHQINVNSDSDLYAFLKLFVVVKTKAIFRAFALVTTKIQFFRLFVISHVYLFSFFLCKRKKDCTTWLGNSTVCKTWLVATL